MYLRNAPRWPEAELRQGTPEVISNHREVIKTRGSAYAPHCPEAETLREITPP